MQVSWRLIPINCIQWKSTSCVEFNNVCLYVIDKKMAELWPMSISNEHVRLNYGELYHKNSKSCGPEAARARFCYGVRHDNILGIILWITQVQHAKKYEKCNYVAAIFLSVSKITQSCALWWDTFCMQFISPSQIVWPHRTHICEIGIPCTQLELTCGRMHVYASIYSVARATVWGYILQPWYNCNKMLIYA